MTYENLATAKSVLDAAIVEAEKFTSSSDNDAKLEATKTLGKAMDTAQDAIDLNDQIAEAEQTKQEAEANEEWICPDDIYQPFLTAIQDCYDLLNIKDATLDQLEQAKNDLIAKTNAVYATKPAELVLYLDSEDNVEDPERLWKQRYSRRKPDLCGWPRWEKYAF